MQFFRDLSKSWVMYVVLFLILFGFIFLGFTDMFVSPGAQGVVAKVNGTSINERDIQQRVQVEKQRLRQQFGGEVDEQLLDSIINSDTVFQQLLNEQLIQQLADKMNLVATKQEVDAFILDYPAFKDENGQYSPEQFKSVLKQSGYPNIASFRAAVSKDISVQQFRDSIANSVVVTDKEIAADYTVMAQKRAYHYALFNAEQLNIEAQVKAEEIQAYYDDNQEQFLTDEKADLDYVILDLDNIAKKIPVDEEALRASYEEMTMFDDSLGSFEDEKAAMVLEKQRESASELFNEQFAVLQNLSDLNESVEVAAEQMALTVESLTGVNIASPAGLFAAPELKSALGAYEVLSGDNNGFALINDGQQAVMFRVAEYNESEVKPFDDVKPTISALLSEQSKQAQLVAMADDLVAELKSGDKSLKSLADSYTSEVLAQNAAGRNEVGVPREISAMVFEMAEQEGTSTFAEVELPSKQIALIELNDILETTIDTSSEEWLQFAQSAKQQSIQSSLVNLVEAYKANSDIKTYKDEYQL